MDAHEGEEYKEYMDLNDFYLKIILSSQDIKLLSCYKKLPEVNFYQSIITIDEIIKNEKYKNLSLKELYQKITNSIENKKYLINKQNNYIMLSLFEGENFDINKDLQFILIKEGEGKKSEYEHLMEKIIKSLIRENDSMKSALEELKLVKAHSAGTEYLSFPGKIEKKESINDIGSATVPNTMPKNYINDGSNTVPNVDKVDSNKGKLNNTYISQKQFESKKSIELNISSLANLNYGSYPAVELSPNASDIIAGYGGNSYNGIIRKNNEDKIKIITDYKLKREVKNKSGDIINPKISYFAIYDGHGGNKCSVFLQENLHEYIFSSNFFPLSTIQAIKAAYIEAENKFLSQVYEPENKKLNDRSGSCAVSALFIDEWCFIINLGDSRGLYSYDGGNKLFQITRDHKPNDPIEKERVEKAGGKIYKDDIVNIKGEKRRIDEKNLAPGIVLPYRIIPGNISVSNIFNINNIFIFIIGCKKYR